MKNNSYESSLGAIIIIKRKIYKKKYQDKQQGLKFPHKIKQQLINDPYNSSIVKGLPPIYCVPIKQNKCILKIVRILQIFSNS